MSKTYKGAKWVGLEPIRIGIEGPILQPGDVTAIIEEPDCLGKKGSGWIPVYEEEEREKEQVKSKGRKS